MTWNRCACQRLTRYPGGLKCRRCQDSEARARDPELTKLRCAVFYSQNREYILARQNRYDRENAEATKLRAAVYRAANRERLSEYARNHRKKKRVEN